MIEFLLLSIAIVLLFIIVPIAAVYKIIRSLLNRNSRELKVWFFGTARTIDIFGNVVAAQLFNDTLTKKNGYRFGRRGETISSVIGKNYKTDTLTVAGKGLRKILDFIDPDHSVNSILSDEQINQSKI